MYQSNRIKCAPSSTWCSCKACLEKLARLDLWSSLVLNFRPKIVLVLDDCPILTITLFSNFTPYSLWTCHPKLFVYHMLSNLIEQIMIKITNKGKCPSYLSIAFGESCDAVDVEVSWLFSAPLQALYPSPRWPRNILVADLFTKIVWSWQRDETTFEAFVESKYASANTLSKHGKYSHRITQYLWKPSVPSSLTDDNCKCSGLLFHGWSCCCIVNLLTKNQLGFVQQAENSISKLVGIFCKLSEEQFIRWFILFTRSPPSPWDLRISGPRSLPPTPPGSTGRGQNIITILFCQTMIFWILETD